MKNQEENGPSAAGIAGEGVVGFAILGCLVAGSIGIVKAVGATSGFDTLCCIAGAVLAFGAVIWLYFSKRL